MSYKTFQNGFPLPASDLNNYLMNQVVATFANSTARSSAIASPQEGQVTYLEDTESYEKWDGSAWVDFFPEAVAATSPNYIINGAFDFWQRGTSISFSSSSLYTADRFFLEAASGSGTVSRQTFTPGAAPVAGYEGQFFSRITVSSAGDIAFGQRIEDVRTLAGQTVTLSFWAKASASTSFQYAVYVQQFGSGGSSDVFGTPAFTDSAITTSWKRFTATFTVPSISGKTVGSGSYFYIRTDLAESFTGSVDLWGVQLEAGSVATPFRRNANSIQGELAACQRYYVRFNQNESAYAYLGTQGIASSTTNINFMGNLPVSMRVTPTSVEWSGFHASDTVNNLTASAIGIDPAQSTRLTFNLAATVSGATQYRTYFARAFNNSAHYLAFNAEL